MFLVPDVRACGFSAAGAARIFTEDNRAAGDRVGPKGLDPHNDMVGEAIGLPEARTEEREVKLVDRNLVHRH